MAYKGIPKKAVERLNILKKAVEKHRYNTHVLDRQDISEAALDSLKRELADIEKKYPGLLAPDSPSERVAGEPLKEFKKIIHKVPQWSFNDAFDEKEIIDFDTRLKKMLKSAGQESALATYSAELKIDGLKIVLSYKKGVLESAATRGDGKIGENVTENIKMIESIPLKLQSAVDLIVEGEVYMSKKQFDLLNQKRKKINEPLFANPRNVAAGSVRQLDPKIVKERHLSSFIYDIARVSGKNLETQIEELKYLSELGFKVNSHYEHCQNISDVINYWNKWKEKAQSLDYLADGVVIKVNEKKYEAALGYTGKAPRFGIAIKFPAKQATSVVKDITLQIGRTGVLTPVAHLKEVAVDGSMVSRATLHNEDEIKRLDVRIGDTVIIQKAGDVIPDIVSVLKEMRSGKEKVYQFPKKVAACGGDGSIERASGEAAWRCVNKNSYAQNKRKLYYFVGKSAFNIDGLGPRIVDVLLDNNLVSDASDFFTLKSGDLLSLDRFGEKSVDNLLCAIEKARKITLQRFITALSIPNVGEETAEDLARRFGEIEKISQADEVELSSINGIGPTVAKSIKDWFSQKQNKNLINQLQKYIEIIKPKMEKNQGKLSGKNFVLTGTLRKMTRDQAKEKIKKLGGHIGYSVSKATNFVVFGENSGSKLNEAKRLGVMTINEEQFLKMLA